MLPFVIDCQHESFHPDSRQLPNEWGLRLHFSIGQRPLRRGFGLGEVSGLVLGSDRERHDSVESYRSKAFRDPCGGPLEVLRLWNAFRAKLEALDRLLMEQSK